MDVPFHDNPPARLIPSTRSLAMLTLGIGIGVVAALPLGGNTAIAGVVAVAAASAAAAVAFLRPSSPGAIVTADVLLGVAVIATVFGRLGVLYVPVLLAFLAVTARIERTQERSEAGLRWEPAPEFEEAVPPSVAAPPPLAEPEVPAFEEVGDAPPILPSLRIEIPPAPPPVADELEPKSEPEERSEAGAAERHPGRHRAPSPARRVAAGVAQTTRRLGDQAKAGAANLRAAIAAAPSPDAPPPPDPIVELEAPEEDRPDAPRSAVDELQHGLDDLRHEFEERELELVAAGKPWSALTHRAYGELRFLPPPTPPEPPRRSGVIRIDDADWEAPTWKTIGDP